MRIFQLKTWYQNFYYIKTCSKESFSLKLLIYRKYVRIYVEMIIFLILKKTLFLFIFTPINLTMLKFTFY